MRAPFRPQSLRWKTKYAENTIASSTKTSKRATSAKGTEDHSLPRWATSSHHSLGAIHKHIIALIEAQRSPQWTSSLRCYCVARCCELLRTPSTRSSQKTASLSTLANRGEVEGWA